MAMIMIVITISPQSNTSIDIFNPYHSLIPTTMGSNIGNANAIHNGIRAVVQDTLSSPANLYACVKALVDRDAVSPII